MEPPSTPTSPEELSIDDPSSHILGVLGVLGGSMIVGMIDRARFQRVRTAFRYLAESNRSPDPDL